MQILQNFGFEPLLFIAQIVNFLIILVVFKKFLYKPILKVLKDREHKIQKGLTDAEEAEKARASAEAEKDKIVSSAGKEAEKILEETKKTAEEMRDKILSDAKTNAEKIINDAREQANIQMTNMEKQAKAAALDVSVKLLDKVISEIFSKDEKNKILQKSLSELKKVE